MAKKDAIIVHSGYLTNTKDRKDRQMDDESRSRVDKGVELLRKGEANFLVMSGGPGRFTDMSLVPRGTYPVHCEVMRARAIELGVPKELIFEQGFSVDTFGEVYFTKEGIAVPNSFRDNLAVSSRYHIKRLEKIYRKIMGGIFRTDFDYVATQKDNDPAVLMSEEDLLRMFEGQMRGIPDGDSKKIERALYELHPLYMTIPETQRLRFYR
jgi:uncharacterized SAM-binding protein YcdF (DUF218 family)